MKGRIHSFQSMGAVDGPGLRYCVFMQGCPLRCSYCHNPDTWDFSGGEEYDSKEVAEKILRYRGYIQKQGGVTVTGGEPLLQGEFVGELFSRLQGEGIHTALDTSGICASKQTLDSVLKHTDLVLCDIKFLSEQEYITHCKASFRQVEDFLRLTQERELPLWVRHVVVPGLTDGEEHIRALVAYARSYSNLQKIELLPFRKLCLEKYKTLGLTFPLGEVPELSQERLEELIPLTVLD